MPELRENVQLADEVIALHGKNEREIYDFVIAKKAAIVELLGYERALWLAMQHGVDEEKVRELIVSEDD